MNEQVAKFIEKAKEEAKKEAEDVKRGHLFSLGLLEKREYISRGELGEQRDGLKWDPVKGQYYKSFPIEITEEEYAEICRYAPPKPKIKQEELNVGIGVLGVIGYIVLGIGIISAIAMIGDMPVVALTTFASCGITCAFMVTLGKMLEVLKAIKRKIDTM